MVTTNGYCWWHLIVYFQMKEYWTEASCSDQELSCFAGSCFDSTDRQSYFDCHWNTRRPRTIRDKSQVWKITWLACGLPRWLVFGPVSKAIDLCYHGLSPKVFWVHFWDSAWCCSWVWGGTWQRCRCAAVHSCSFYCSVDLQSLGNQI